MSIYEKYILPKFLDFACNLKGFQNKRSQIVPYAHGRVLEIGIGSGLNLDFYDFSKIDSITGIDPALPSIALARERTIKKGVNDKFSFLALSAESLPLQDNYFDTAVIAYSLCTIPNPAEALHEIRRVLKPEGKLLFMEHGLSPEQTTQRWQHRLTPYWKKLAGGCHMNRNIEEILQNAGFKFKSLNKKYIKGPKILAFNYYGIAIKS
ncbi:MAG: class I SAM-dependent methyltransferase [Gammaproteobacteria bacterium]|jgi:ubiquinone/menaquinone biosynthesis C-methylase UbiE